MVPGGKPDNIKDIQAHVLAWTYTKRTPRSGARRSQRSIYRPRYTRKGKITTAKYPIENNIIGAIAYEETETGIDEFLLCR
jgi:hypothetical protein